MRTMVIACSLILMSAAIAGAATDADNNGIPNDEPVFIEPVFNGDIERDVVVIFPTAADTWDVTFYPYWWNLGDTAYGMHDPGIGAVTHADITLKLSYNILSGSGHVDLDFQIDGATVGSVMITPADGLGYVMASFDFPPKVPPFELRWIETNTVGSGLGSISLDETGECLVDFGNPVGAEAVTWSDIKRLYD